MISLAYAKGPSVTVTFPLERRTRAPSAVGPSPPPPIMLPALLASSLSLSMASISSLGGWPKRSADLTIIMNFMVTSPLLVGARSPHGVSRDKKLAPLIRRTKLREIGQGTSTSISFLPPPHPICLPHISAKARPPLH